MKVKVVKVTKKGTKDYGLIAAGKGPDATVSELKAAFEKAARVSRYRQAFKLSAADGKLIVRSVLLSSSPCGYTHKTHLLELTT
jgi:hypothetical protein